MCVCVCVWARGTIHSAPQCNATPAGRPLGITKEKDSAGGEQARDLPSLGGRGEPETQVGSNREKASEKMDAKKSKERKKRAGDKVRGKGMPENQWCVHQGCNVMTFFLSLSLSLTLWYIGEPQPFYCRSHLG